MKPPSLQTGLRLLALLFGSTLAPAAHADDTARAHCLEVHARGQEAERAGQLKSALGDYQSCAASECPTLIRRDCLAWRGRVEDALPTIVVRVTGAGTFSIFIDDVGLTADATGRAIPVDPGPHELRVETSGGITRQRFIATQGAKNQVVEAHVSPLASPEPDARRSSGSSLVGPLLLGGVGVALVGGFAGLGAMTSADARELRARCAPDCAKSDVDDLRTRYLVADALLLGGTLALAGALTWFVLTRPSRTPTTLARF